MEPAKEFRILVGIDFSPSAARALHEAASIALRLGARLLLVHVFPVSALSAEGELVRSRESVAHYHEAWQRLEALANDVPAGVPVELRIRLGHPTRGLLDAIELMAPDMVVVGSHGRGILGRALLGSVSQRVARRSPVPVLVVPAEHLLTPTEETDELQRERSFELALSCSACGHIQRRGKAPEQCPVCGLKPAQWVSAPVLPGPVDEDLPAVGEPLAGFGGGGAPDPTVLFPVAPGGTSGQAVNPELKIRY